MYFYVHCCRKKVFFSSRVSSHDCIAGGLHIYCMRKGKQSVSKIVTESSFLRIFWYFKKTDDFTFLKSFLKGAYGINAISIKQLQKGIDIRQLTDMVAQTCKSRL